MVVTIVMRAGCSGDGEGKTAGAARCNVRAPAVISILIQTSSVADSVYPAGGPATGCLRGLAIVDAVPRPAGRFEEGVMGFHRASRPGVSGRLERLHDERV